MQRTNKKPITLKDIASEANISVAAVSAALNGTGTVSTAMRHRVRAVAERLNYQPNFAAKLLKQRKSRDIGLIVSDIPTRLFGSGYFQPMIAEFIRHCEEMGLRCQIEYHNPEPGHKLPSMLTDGLAGGVLHGGVISSALGEWLARTPDFPFVAFEEQARHCIVSDYEKAGYQAIQYLVAQGHRRLGFVGGPEKYRRQQALADGFSRATREFGCETRPEWTASLALADDAATLSDAVAWGRNVLARPDRPTALFCTDGRVARGLLYAAAEGGVSVPRELSLFACSSRVESEQTYPAVSALTWNAEEALFKGIHLLRHIMGSEGAEGQTLTIEPVVTLRQSTGRAPS